MSVSKLLSRIVTPAKILEEEEAENLALSLHDHTFGINSDPLTQFAVVLSALIHDVDHAGVSNHQLVQENHPLAQVYKKQSVAEQNSIVLAWEKLMSPKFVDLRRCIYSCPSELERFRQIVVNSVLATDIFDQNLQAVRRARWEKAFAKFGGDTQNPTDDINRKATIVMEHLIQASDVSHTMQHWHIYKKWNERLFAEMTVAYRNGRMANDPKVGWYQGELGFLDNYIIPLAKKLKECGVFGVSCDEYLNYALENRREWASKGEEVVAGYVAQYCQEESKDDGNGPGESGEHTAAAGATDAHAKSNN
jgi:3'5'-cyclic nucleotide phosphodiesterase